jgi:hypothetical protein
MAFVKVMIPLLVLIQTILQASGTTIPETVSYEVSRARSLSDEDYAKQLKTFWNEKRIKAARPIEELRPNLANSRVLDTVLRYDNSTTVYINGTLPSLGLSNSRFLPSANQAAQTVGKLYLMLDDSPGSCSASVVTTPSMSLIVSAAHCVFDLETRSWMNQFLFVPSYDMDFEPLGVWAIKNVMALNAYVLSSASNRNWSFDVSFLVALPLNNRRIAEVRASYSIHLSDG